MVHIRLKNVTLSYPIYTAENSSLRATLGSQIGGKIGRSQKGTRVVTALSDVSIEINSGDRVGIIGHNGAGKSTLLKVLAQIFYPQIGQVEIKGEVSCLVDITLGMNAELSGLENIRLRGIVLGLTNRQIKDLTPSIVEFSELGDFIHMPIRTYSSGMYMRLAFAITTAVYPEILVMDEMIGAGDAAFLDKAVERMEDMIGQTEIMVVATHSNFIIRKFCNKVIWMGKGEVKDYGNVEEIISSFEEHTEEVLST